MRRLESRNYKLSDVLEYVRKIVKDYFVFIIIKGLSMKIIGSYIIYETLTSYWNVSVLTLLSELDTSVFMFVSLKRIINLINFDNISRVDLYGEEIKYFKYILYFRMHYTRCNDTHFFLHMILQNCEIRKESFYSKLSF